MAYLFPSTNNTVPVTGLVNANVTTSGSFILTNVGLKEVNLVINVTGSVTGTSPTLTFTLEEIDPGNSSTQIGTIVSGVAIIATGTQTLKLADTTTGAVKVVWTIGGTSSPTFNGVYATLSFKSTEDIIEQFIPAAEDNTNGVIAHAIKPLAVALYTPSVSINIGSLSGVVKASTGNLRSIKMSNRSAVNAWLQLFNSTTFVTTTLFDQFFVPPGSMIIVGEDYFSTNGINFSTGIAWGYSSTATSFSASATASLYDFCATYA